MSFVDMNKPDVVCWAITIFSSYNSLAFSNSSVKRNFCCFNASYITLDFQLHARSQGFKRWHMLKCLHLNVIARRDHDWIMIRSCRCARENLLLTEYLMSFSIATTNICVTLRLNYIKCNEGHLPLPYSNGKKLPVTNQPMHIISAAAFLGNLSTFANDIY